MGRLERVATRKISHVLTSRFRLPPYPHAIMARSDLVKRSQAAGRRGVGQAPVEDQVRWHRAQLAEDFGLDKPDNRPPWKDPQEGVGAAVRRLALFTALSMSALAGAAGWTMWRDGRIDAWLDQARSGKPLPRRPWTLPEKLVEDAQANSASSAQTPPWPDPYEYPTPKPASPPPEAVTQELPEDAEDTEAGEAQ